MKTLQMTLLGIIIPLLSWAQTPSAPLFGHTYPSDSVVISGQILNRTIQTAPYVALGHFITGESIRITIPLDASGNFRVKVPVFSTTRLYLNYVSKGNSIVLLVEPKEEIVVQTDWKSDRTVIQGANGKVHQEVFNYHRYLETMPRSYLELISDDKITNEQYLQKVKRLAFQQDSILNHYVEQHPQISAQAKQQIRIETYNTVTSDLMQRRFDLDRANGEKFSKAYMAYADSLFASLPKPYTAVSATFLCDYLGYYSETQQTPTVLRQVLIDYAIEKKRISPSEEQLKNPALILQSKEFQPLIAAGYHELLQTDSFIRIMLDYYNGGALIVPMPTELKEIVTTQAFYRYLNDMRTALSDAHVDYFKQQVTNAELRKLVLDYQRKLSALESEKLNSDECLKDATPFAECQTGEELFNRLIAPHQGKFIYLDVWGTWCAPCKREMKFAAPIKEAMKEKEVVFFYLANNSPEVAWRNIIKEYRLTGKQVEHYNLPDAQQRMLENYLGIRSYPTYHIIDRHGVVIEKKPLCPSSGKQLIDHLNELLSK